MPSRCDVRSWTRVTRDDECVGCRRVVMFGLGPASHVMMSVWDAVAW